MNDPLVLLATILRTITIPPESGGSAISYIVRAGWLDQANKTTAGEITPTYSIKLMAGGTNGHDGNGLVSKYRDVYEVNVWCQTCGSYEPAANLNWKMVNELFSVIKSNRASADANTQYFEVIDSRDLTDGEVAPPIRRTQILVAAHGFR
jgi:hypothetical protein